MILFFLAFPYWSQNGTSGSGRKKGEVWPRRFCSEQKSANLGQLPTPPPPTSLFPLPHSTQAIMALFIRKSYIAMPRNSQAQNEFPGYIPIYQVRHKSAATYITLASNIREVEKERVYTGYCHSERKHGPFTKEDKKNGYWVTNSCVCHRSDQFPKPC